MTNEIKMIERINLEIKSLKDSYEITKENDPIANAKIIGMMTMLNIATGKEYYYDESGVHER